MFENLSSKLKRTAVLVGMFVAFGAMWLAVTPPAQADALKPVLTLGPTTVANGAVTLSGSAGGPLSNLEFSANGQPLALNAAGQFSGTVNLGGQSVLTLAARNPLTGEVTTTSIPLTANIVGPGGVISPDVLDSLQRAAVSVVKPPGGFGILDALPLAVGGSVAERGELTSLKVNGADVLGSVRPDGSFTYVIPGSSKEVVVTATDRQGASHSTAFPVGQTSSLIATSAGTSVAAAGALGLKIAKVRYVTKGVKAKKRLRMIVTLKDRRGYLVRDAIVQIRSAKAGRVVGGRQVTYSGKKGQASFLVRLTKRAFGKRLVIVALARTPKAQAKKATSVKLPRLARPASARSK